MFSCILGWPPEDSDRGDSALCVSKKKKKNSLFCVRGFMGKNTGMPRSRRHVWPMVSKPWPWRTHPVVLPFYDTASEKKDWLGYRLSYNFAQTWYFGKAWLSEAGYARVREHMRQRPPRVFRRDLATGPPLTAHFRHGGLNVMFLTNILSKSFIANPAALFESWKKYSARGSQLVVVGTNRCEMFSGGRQSRCKEFAG